MRIYLIILSAYAKQGTSETTIHIPGCSKRPSPERASIIENTLSEIGTYLDNIKVFFWKNANHKFSHRTESNK